MARSNQITIPSVRLPLGTFVRTSPALPSDASDIQLILQQGADWVNDGTAVFTISLDYAADGTNFNLNLFNDQANDIAIPSKFGRPAGQMSWGTDIPDIGTSGRKIQFTLTVTARRTVSGELDVL